MTPSLSDDQIDALVRRERLDPPRTTKSWRDTQRAELLAYVDGPGDEPPAASGRAEWTPAPAAGSSLRRWGWVAAGLTVVAGVAALVMVADRDGGRPVATDVSVSSESMAAEPAPSPVANMEAPAIAVSPEVTRLLALPACESTDGLAQWTTDQLGWWSDLDPISAQPAEFSAVTALVAVDTAAVSATCSSAASMGGVLTWGLGDGSGNWVARAAGVPEASEYDWPTAERDIDMDGQFGTGQFFNDFGVGSTDGEAVASGALSPADSAAPSPIYVIEFASDVDLDVVSSRLWYLRTTTATLDENVTGSPNPALVPALVPQGFGRCTVEYARLNSQSIDALAVDYCNTTSTITVTAGKIVDGEPFSIDGVDVLIERDGDTVSVGFAVDGPIVIGPAVVPDDQLAAMLTSIRLDENEGDRATVDAAGAGFEPVLAALEPGREYYATVSTARELVMSNCMADAGFHWMERPNGAADPTSADQWEQWQEWFDSNTADDPTFETAAFGKDDNASSNVGGCQLEAFQQVHGPGEEAFSKAATLTNEALAAQSAFVASLDQMTTDIEALAEADAKAWLEQHAATIEQIRQELDEELDNAQSIIDDVQDSTET